MTAPATLTTSSRSPCYGSYRSGWAVRLGSIGSSILHSAPSFSSWCSCGGGSLASLAVLITTLHSVLALVETFLTSLQGCEFTLLAIATAAAFSSSSSVSDQCSRLFYSRFPNPHKFRAGEQANFRIYRSHDLAPLPPVLVSHFLPTPCFG